MKTTYCISGGCPNKQNAKYQIRESALIHPYQGGFTCSWHTGRNIHRLIEVVNFSKILYSQICRLVEEHSSFLLRDPHLHGVRLCWHSGIGKLKPRPSLLNKVKPKTIFSSLSKRSGDRQFELENVMMSWKALDVLYNKGFKCHKRENEFSLPFCNKTIAIDSKVVKLLPA